MSKTKFEIGDRVFRQKPATPAESDYLLVAGYAEDGRVKVIATNDVSPGIFEFPENELHLCLTEHK